VKHEPVQRPPLSLKLNELDNGHAWRLAL